MHYQITFTHSCRGQLNLMTNEKTMQLYPGFYTGFQSVVNLVINNLKATIRNLNHERRTRVKNVGYK